jgi:anti-sigma regulatory factor (Ser/Thr protein kinase)
MTGGTGAVWAASGGALPASATELRSGVGTASQDWPLMSGLPPLAAIPTAPACARGHVRAVVREWGLSELADTAELLASELVTNAVQASEHLRIRADLPFVPVVRLWLISDRMSVVVRVWDASPEMPVRRDAGPDEISGRGLMIIDMLSADWGWYRKAAGKVVWALIAADITSG